MEIEDKKLSRNEACEIEDSDSDKKIEGNHSAVSSNCKNI